MNKHKQKTFKRHRDYGFFDQDIRLSKLSHLGDPLEKLSKHVDFEMFRPFLEEHLSVEPQGLGGRPPYDYVLMFKILILQRYFNLADDQVEYQINDRMSFMRFLGLTIADDVPDSKTVWHFRERLVDLDLAEPLFNLFLEHLEAAGMVAHQGKIVDASFVEVPRQRNHRAENEQIKAGEIPASFKENPHRLAQKDCDARWTKKNNDTIFGYSNTVKGDRKSKLITAYKVTAASVHDSQVLEPVLDKAKDRGQPLFADSAYTGQSCEKVIAEAEMINGVNEKGYRGHPLTDEQKENNRLKSKVRARVEHIFGFMENSMNEMYINTIGLPRAATIIGLMNLTYNMFRKVQIVELGL
jgi:IS5 family transposase